MAPLAVILVTEKGIALENQAGDIAEVSEVKLGKKYPSYIETETPAFKIFPENTPEKVVEAYDKLKGLVKDDKDTKEQYIREIIESVQKVLEAAFNFDNSEIKSILDKITKRWQEEMRNLLDSTDSDKVPLTKKIDAAYKSGILTKRLYEFAETLGYTADPIDHNNEIISNFTDNGEIKAFISDHHRFAWIMIQKLFFEILDKEKFLKLEETQASLTI